MFQGVLCIHVLVRDKQTAGFSRICMGVIKRKSEKLESQSCLLPC